MDLIELTEFIIKSIVTDEESVSVKEFPTEDENTILIQVIVSEDDMGKVIGKNGKCANAIRTLVQASSALNDNKYAVSSGDRIYMLGYFKTVDIEEYFIPDSDLVQLVINVEEQFYKIFEEILI